MTCLLKQISVCVWKVAVGKTLQSFKKKKNSYSCSVNQYIRTHTFYFKIDPIAAKYGKRGIKSENFDVWKVRCTRVCACVRLL